MYGYIYITHNEINGKIYIGQRKGKYCKHYKGSGKCFQNAINKYGKENFETYILEWCNNKNELDDKEIFWIKKYNCNAKNKFGYNIAAGGHNNPFEYMTDEKKKNRSKKIKSKLQGNKNPLGNKHSEETKAKISKKLEGNKGRLGMPHSESSKNKMSKNISRKFVAVYKDEVYNFESRNDMISYFEKLEIKIWNYTNANYDMNKVAMRYRKLFKFIGRKENYECTL